MIKRVLLAGKSERADWVMSALKELSLTGIDIDSPNPPSASLMILILTRDIDEDMVDNFLESNRKNIPVLAVVERENFPVIENESRVSDFMLNNQDALELKLRVKRLIKTRETAAESIEQGDLLIDMAKCEVTLAGREVVLSFKEYELLKFLAGNPGRVFTRDALLDKVWGYEYFGGDRTVDVHIRRLRSKIEDSQHGFIETVRNIGYRFTVNPSPES